MRDEARLLDKRFVSEQILEVRFPGLIDYTQQLRIRHKSGLITRA
jgi:hypothetical protein